MKDDGDKKVDVIKEVSGENGMGMKEDKEMVEYEKDDMKEGVRKEEEEEMKKDMEEDGDEVEVK